MINLKKGAEGAISRREVVGGLAAGAVGLVAGWTKPADAEPPPETTRLRVSQFVGGLCAVPQYVAKELFISEGFTDMQYVPRHRRGLQQVAGLRRDRPHHGVRRAVRHPDRCR